MDLGLGREREKEKEELEGTGGVSSVWEVAWCGVLLGPGGGRRVSAGRRLSTP